MFMNYCAFIFIGLPVASTFWALCPKRFNLVLLTIIIRHKKANV
jgi:hypothetical protein